MAQNQEASSAQMQNDIDIINSRKILLVNLYLASKQYLLSNYKSLLVFTLILSSPKIYRQAIKYRYSLFQQIKSHQELDKLLIKEKEIFLRVRFLGVQLQKHRKININSQDPIGDKQSPENNQEIIQPNYQSMYFIHEPLFGRQNSQKSQRQNIQTQDFDMTQHNEILNFRLSGVHYPLIDRCVKELQHPHFKLFQKPQFINLSLKDNQLQGFNPYNLDEASKKLYHGFIVSASQVTSGNFNLHLANEGMIKSIQGYKRNNDFDNIKEFSIGYEAMIKEFLGAEQGAKLSQRGPIWEQYQSEFVKEKKLKFIRTFAEKIINKIYYRGQGKLKFQQFYIVKNKIHPFNIS